MRIAIVHEWLVPWAGSERVVAEIVKCFPEADLYALVDSLSEVDRRHLGGRRAHTSFIQRLPFGRRRPWVYFPLLPLAIEQLDLSAYDLIISSAHAVAKGVITGPDQIHLSYVHSPMRYAWDLQHQYLRDVGPIRRVALRGLLHYLRMWDTRTSNGVDAFAANSAFVARRIWKTYRRESRVIHPPVDLGELQMRAAKEDFYLCASRMMSYKRVDLVVAAFAQMPDRRLIVIGDGPGYRSIRRLAGPNVTFLGYQPDPVLRTHLQNARAFVFAAQEDFGILPVEAQACGTPVIAFARGGVSEIVRDLDTPTPTGLFFDSQSVPAIIDAVRRFEQLPQGISPEHCRQNAERFSPDRFREEFRDFVATSIASGHGATPAGSRSITTTRRAPR